MIPYLFLWNPKKDTNSFKNYERVRLDAEAGRAYVTRWICPSKQPRPGDVAILQRTGSKNNGIFAKGIVTSEPFESDDGFRVVGLRLDSFLPLGEEIPRKEIVATANYQKPWMPMASGNVVPEPLHEAIQTLWIKRTSAKSPAVVGTLSPDHGVPAKGEDGLAGEPPQQVSLGSSSMRAKFVESVEIVARGLDPSRRRVLEALLFAPQYSASAGQLKTLLGLSAVIEVNAAIGFVGRRVKEEFGAHPDGLADGEYEWWHVIATGSQQVGKAFVWQLREEVVEALLASGWSASGAVLPVELNSAEVFSEGEVRQRIVKAYERSRVARERCIEAYGCTCAICGFDFGLAYGKGAEGFIHVHHINPLASIGAQYEINPVEDLRPVCPNCHAVIHMPNSPNPPRSLEEVKAMMAGAVQANSASNS